MKQDVLKGLILLAAFVTNPASAADATTVNQPVTIESAARRSADQTSLRRWKMSVAPVFASQALDVASSYRMRELNPMLASSDGHFGAKGAGIKLGSTAAMVGLEYWILRKHPRAAPIFTKINWSVSIVTTGFAAHNFAIR
ncbi:MAG: hypothetical protein ACRD4E_00090 [Bryobacteraceae bacterium]